MSNHERLARSGDQNSERLREVSDTLANAQAEAALLRTKLEGLETAYRAAGGALKSRAQTDVEYISRLKGEAEIMVGLLRGGSLFSRYAADADHNKRVANSWRFFAVLILLAGACLEVWLAIRYPEIGWFATAAPALPLTLLFSYAAYESFNHRRREFDRRRIYLRIAAIESYIAPSGSVPSPEGRRLLDEFVRRHFIDPDLDSNEAGVVTASGAGPFSQRIREGTRQRSEGKQGSQE